MLRTPALDTALPTITSSLHKHSNPLPRGAAPILLYYKTPHAAEKTQVGQHEAAVESSTALMGSSRTTVGAGDEMKRPPKEVRQTEESMSCLWTSAWADVCDSDSVHGSHDMFPMSFGHTQKFQVLTGTTADSPAT